MLGVISQKEGLGNGCVAAANDGNVFPSKEKPIARRAPRDAIAKKFFFSWDAKFARRCAGCKDNNVCCVRPIFREGTKRAATPLHRRDARRYDWNTETAYLLLHAIHKSEPEDGVRKTWEIFNFSCLCELSAGIAASTDNG